MQTKKRRSSLSVVLSACLILSMLPVRPEAAWANSSIPTLNAYPSGNHVKLEWAVEMQAVDILTQTSFEGGQEAPNFQGGGNPGIGNQSIVSGAAYTGSQSMQVTNTQNGTGNSWYWPSTYSNLSVSKFSARRIPDNSTLSINYKVRGFGGTNGNVTWSNESPWGNQGLPLTDYSGKTVYYGERIDWNNTPPEISVYVQGGGSVNFNENELFHIVTSHHKDHNYGLLFYRWSTAKQKLVLDPVHPPGSKPFTAVNNFGHSYTANMDTFQIGEPVLQNYWVYVGFPGRNIPMDGQWYTVSSNAHMSNPYYNFYQNGFVPTIVWTTDGVLQVDDLKFGYATKVNLYRDGQLIYSGYLSDYEDTSAVDTTPPAAPASVHAAVHQRKPVIQWAAAADQGTTYHYTIQGVSNSGTSPMSTAKLVTVTSGIKGYSIVVDSNPSTVPDNIIETTATSYTWPNQVSSNFYVHIAAVDHEGNISSVAHVPYMDTAAPTIAISPNTTNWTSGDITLTASASDNETGIYAIQHPNGSWITGDSSMFTVTANGSYRFIAKDNAGNTREMTYHVTNIDKTAPEQPTIHLNPAGWSSSNVGVTIASGADSQSGVQKSQYKIGSGAWIDYTGPFTVSSEGQTSISAQTIDNAGNASSVAKVAALIDHTGPAAPVLTLSEDDWTNQPVTFTISDGADTGSGAAKSQYKIGAAGAWTDYTVPVSITSEGQTEVWARTLDQVGNASQTIAGTAKIDQTPPSDPSITLSESTWTPHPVTFLIKGSLDLNVVSYEYKLSNGSYAAGNSGTVSTNGETVVTARAKDSVGNTGNEVTRSIYIDNEKPTIHISSNVQDWTADDVPVTITYEDLHSGIDENKRFYKITSSPASPSSWDAAASNSHALMIDQEGIWYVHAKTEDLAGNSYETVSQVIQLQRKAEVPVNVRISQVTETTAEVTFDLPQGVYTDGYSHEVMNTTTGSSWTLQYPDHSILDTGLQGGRTYSYTVRAINHTGSSPSSAPVTALTLPRAPENVVIHPVETAYSEAAVSFDPVDSAVSYRITAKDSSQTEVYQATVTDTVYQPIQNLSPGTMYTISIHAVNASGEGAGRHTGYLSLPASPGNFRTVQVGERDIQLSWESVTSATYYSLSRDGVPLVVNGQDLQFQDTGLEPGRDYHYELYASNDSGAGSTSTLSVITVPEAVSNLQVSGAAASSMNLSWNAVNGADQYVILRDGQLYQTVPAGTTQLFVHSLTAGTAYTFEVYAENKSGQGGPIQAKGLTIPDPAQGLKAEAVTETDAVISWAPSHGADRYRITANGSTLETAGTQAVLTGLEGSKLYSISVEAGNAAGYTPETVHTFLTAPYAPANLHVIETMENSISLKWDAVDTANAYVISQDGRIIGNSINPDFKAEGLDAGRAYGFTVQAVNDSGTGNGTPISWVTKPSAPTGITPISDAYRAEVSWNVVEGAVQYVVEEGGAELYRGSAPKAVLTGLKDGTEYSYTVRAVNKHDISSEKAIINILTKPKKPVEVSAMNIQMKQLTLDLSSTAVIGADQYVIEHDGSQIAAISATEQAYISTGLTPGTKYNYRIKAQNASGAGEDYSLDVTTQTAAADPTGILVSPETHEVTVAWDAVQGAVSYQIRNVATDETYSISGDTTTTIINLPDGSLISFELTTINASGVISQPTGFEALTKPVSPAAAAVGQVTDTTVMLDLSNSSVRGADEYVIERDGLEVGRVPVDAYVFTDRGLTAGTVYSYTVKAVNASGVSEGGFPLQVKTMPATVTDSATIVDVTTSSVTISWEPAAGADGYKVMIGDSIYTLTDQTSVMITELVSAMKWNNVRIIPYHEAGSGEAIFVPEFETLPRGDFVVEANAFSIHDIQFDWRLVSEYEFFVLERDGKRLYRGKDRSFVLTGLTPGERIEVQVWTENEGGGKSEAITVKAQTLNKETDTPRNGGAGYAPADASAEIRNDAVLAAAAEKSLIYFEDISTVFNKEEIIALAEQDIIKGMTETRFEPSRPISRAEFTALVVRLMGFQAVDYQGEFRDVSHDSWYAPYIGTGYAHGIIEGKGKGIFAPHEQITREQASVILANVMRAAQEDSEAQSPALFKDHDRISYWAVERVEYLTSFDMVKGYEDGTFRPFKDLSRAEAAALIYRLKAFIQSQ